MEQQQEIPYQGELFTQTGKDAIRPFRPGEAVCGAELIKALQVKGAGGKGRALVHDLMERILCHSNIKEAYQQVKRNKGAAGVDQMTVGEFAPWYVEHGENLISQLYQGIYQPQMVRQVEIPKPQGGKPKLGIPTITDRVIQQGIAQVLSPICEKKFSDQSYGFRPGRNAHQALWKKKRVCKIRQRYRSRSGLEDLLRCG
jgi:RNA-directed DNA polymerase